ncbi:hypothetical protein ACHAWF_017608 [Thalassiosira exigua]
MLRPLAPTSSNHGQLQHIQVPSPSSSPRSALAAPSPFALAYPAPAIASVIRRLLAGLALPLAFSFFAKCTHGLARQIPAAIQAKRCFTSLRGPSLVHGDQWHRFTVQTARRSAFHSSCLSAKNDNSGNASQTALENADVAQSSAEVEAADTRELVDSFTDVPGATNTKQKTLAIIYTCKVCNTRSAKQFTEHAYKHGVVLVRCPGCQNLHLIADRLGWFEDAGKDGRGWDVEGALAKAGENVKAVTGDNVLELTVDDIIGKKE